MALPHVPSASSALTLQTENLLDPLRAKRHLQLQERQRVSSFAVLLRKKLVTRREEKQQRSSFHFSFYGRCVGIGEWPRLGAELSARGEFCEVRTMCFAVKVDGSGSLMATLKWLLMNSKAGGREVELWRCRFVPITFIFLFPRPLPVTLPQVPFRIIPLTKKPKRDRMVKAMSQWYQLTARSASDANWRCHNCWQKKQ